MKSFLLVCAFAVLLPASGETSPKKSSRLLPERYEYTQGEQARPADNAIIAGGESAIARLEAFALRASKAVTDNPEFEARTSGLVWYTLPPSNPNQDRYVVVVDFLLKEDKKGAAMSAAEKALQPDWSNFIRDLKKDTPYEAFPHAVFPAEPKNGCSYILTFRERSDPSSWPAKAAKP